MLAPSVSTIFESTSSTARANAREPAPASTAPPGTRVAEPHLFDPRSSRARRETRPGASPNHAARSRARAGSRRASHFLARAKRASSSSWTMARPSLVGENGSSRLPREDTLGKPFERAVTRARDLRARALARDCREAQRQASAVAASQETRRNPGNSRGTAPAHAGQTHAR